jgi:hypothetical protein
MGAFSGLKDASRGYQSNALQAGKYVARIDECAFFDSAKGEMWKNTLTILAIDPSTGPTPHKVGEVVNTFFKVQTGAGGKNTFQGNLKAFLAGVLDVADDQIGEAEAGEACGEKSPMKGLVTVVTARRVVSQKTKDAVTGQPVSYVVYSWSPCLDAEQINAALSAEDLKRFFPSGL